MDGRCLSYRISHSQFERDHPTGRDAWPDTVVLKRYQLAQFAYLDRAKLADEGIEAFIRDDSVVSMMPYLAYAFGGIKLLVYEEDAERAKEIIESNNFDSLQDMYGDDIEPQRVCPQCKSADIIQQRSVLSGLLFLAFFFVPLATPTHRFICASCGHEWKEEQGGD